MKRKIVLLASVILLLNACKKEDTAREQQLNQEKESLETEIKELEKTLSLKKDSLEKYDKDKKILEQQWEEIQRKLQIEEEKKRKKIVASKQNNKPTSRQGATNRRSSTSANTEETAEQGEEDK